MYSLVMMEKIDDGRNAGMVRHLPNRVEIEAGMTAVDTLETKLHEYIHLVSEAYGMKLTEKQTCVLGVGLTQILHGVVDPWRI